ncbi:MAG: adenosine deaminase [Bacteroidales bacterium]|nr:adenosine deaminase [Bacteroidales bacterium]
MIKTIQSLPKVELHLHIEGSFEPELMFEIGKRNGIKLPYNSIEDIRKAYQFSNLQDFLDIYYTGCNVLQKEQDFYDLTYAYFQKAKENNVLHTEIFFDPQTHTDRGIAFETVVLGITKAMADAEKKLNISSHLIMSFLRHLSEEAAIEILKMAEPFKDKFIAIGLDSSENGNPPKKFQKVYAMAGEQLYKRVAHAGEEGPAQYIWDSLSMLNIDRLDHGNRAMEDKALLNELKARKIGLTLCPLSNLKLKVVKDLKDHPIKTMLDLGLKVTVNSDDPAYFGGYMNDNFTSISEALNLSKEDLYNLSKNAIEVSWAGSAQKRDFMVKLDKWMED